MKLFQTRAAHLAFAAQLLCASCAVAEGGARVVPAPATDEPRTQTHGTETAVLAGGCFWGMQGVFEHVKGVSDTVVGYAGGKKETAHYERIEEGDTNHAESIKITYDPAQISYGEI